MSNIVVSHDLHKDTFVLHIFGQKVGVLDRGALNELERLIHATLHSPPEPWHVRNNESLYDHRGVAV